MILHINRIECSKCVLFYVQFFFTIISDYQKHQLFPISPRLRSTEVTICDISSHKTQKQWGYYQYRHMADMFDTVCNKLLKGYGWCFLSQVLKISDILTEISISVEISFLDLFFVMIPCIQNQRSRGSHYASWYESVILKFALNR